MEKFELVSSYKPTGDQPQAINKIVEGIEDGLKYQTILGVTGSGKTFTMANIINNINRPTLVIAHNKTLASLGSFFHETEWNILFRITIIISQKPILLVLIPISKRI